MRQRNTAASTEALKLLNFATTLDPLVVGQRDFTEKRHYIQAAWEAEGLECHQEYNTAIKLWGGMYDTGNIVSNALTDRQKDYSFHEALAITQHDVSVATIAHAAQLDQDSLAKSNARQNFYNAGLRGDDPLFAQATRLTDPAGARRFIIDDALGAIIQHPEFNESAEIRDGSRGCPFAYGDKHRPKVFDKFVRWAGTVAVVTYFKGSDFHV